MDFLELARSRYSVRGYLEREVEDEKLEKILEAGQCAPSACNNQPCLFIVIRNKSDRQRLGDVYNRSWFLNAPVILAACCDRSNSWRRGDGKDYGDVDIAIAVDHITLAAANLGLGTCWVGAFDAENARKILMLPENIDPVAFIPLGYPSAVKPTKKRKSLDEMVHWEFYGGKKQAY